MAYVGAYQVRQVGHLACPAFGQGCEAVADAPFAHPYGVPDGFLGAGLYLLVLGSLGLKTQWAPNVTAALVAIVVLSNVQGIIDMARLGQWCFWCLTTAALSLLQVMAVVGWRRHRARIATR